MKKFGKILWYILAIFLFVALVASFVVDMNKGKEGSTSGPGIITDNETQQDYGDNEQGMSENNRNNQSDSDEYDYIKEDGTFDYEQFELDYPTYENPNDIDTSNARIDNVEEQIAIYEDTFEDRAKSLGCLGSIDFEYNNLNNTYTMTAILTNKIEKTKYQDTFETPMLQLGWDMHYLLNMEDCECRTRIKIEDKKGNKIFKMENKEEQYSIY